MKKAFRSILLVALCAVLALMLAACGSKTLKDGTYYAENARYDDSGWKANLTIEVRDGKIISADWNAVNQKGGDDKKTQSKQGAYSMVQYGGAQWEWHEQAARMEEELLRVQNPGDIKVASDGKTDTVSGVTIAVDEFVDLARNVYRQAGK
nr:FMN-binding protein [Maliibacterium massiliense]